MRKVISVSLLALSAGAAIAASAVKPEEAIKYRQGVYQVIRWNFAPLGAMAKGEIPFDPKVAANNSARIEAMTHMILEGFPQGSEQGAKTAAKPEIWQNWDDFQSKLEHLQTQAGKLAQVARAGDEAAFKTQVGETAKACKACHDKYREQ